MVEQFLASLEREQTRKAYARCLEHFSAFVNGQPLTPSIVDAYRTSLLHSGLAPASVALYLSAVRSFGAYLQQTTGHGIPAVKGVKVEQPLVDLPSAAVLEHAERLLKTDQERAIWAVLKDSGIRVSELVALQVPDVDVIQKRIRIRNGKGGKSRFAFLSQTACDALSGLLRGRSAGWVYQGHKGRALTPRAVEYLFQRLSNETGFRLHPHVLRHLRATTVVAKTGDIALAQVALGHASIATTQRYVHLATDAVQAKLEDTF